MYIGCALFSLISTLKLLLEFNCITLFHLWSFWMGISSLEVLGGHFILEVLGGYLISGGSRWTFHLWRFSVGISSLEVLSGYFLSGGPWWLFPPIGGSRWVFPLWRLSVGISSMEVLGGYLISEFFDGYFISGGSRCVFHLWRFSVGMSYITNITRVLSLSLSCENILKVKHDF